VLNQSHGISNQPSSTSSFSSAAVSYALGILGQLREYKLHFDTPEEHHRQLVRIDSATGAGSASTVLCDASPLRLSSTAATPSNLSARLNRKVSASWAMIVDDYYYEANRRMKHYKQESRKCK
jgi:hypothetical protein